MKNKALMRGHGHGCRLALANPAVGRKIIPSVYCLLNSARRPPALILFLSVLLLLILWSPTTGQAAGWISIGSLTWNRNWHTATLLPNGKVLAVGGINSSYGHLLYNELYDPATSTWGSTSGLAVGRCYHTATLLLNGKVLVAGGEGSSTVYLTSAELYDPATGTWPTGSMAAGRRYHTATRLSDGKVLVAGGEGSGAATLASSELYDPGTSNWTTIAPMSTPRVRHTATLLPNGKVLVAGGYIYNNLVYPPTTTYLASAELYDPGTGAWSLTGSLPMGWAAHKAVLLENGKVLVVGGTNGGASYLTNAVLYDPAAGTWTPTGAMSTGRYGHTATLLPNSKVLVTGSLTPGVDSACLSSAELYDPAAGTWGLADSMATGRGYHTATLLGNNGKVLVAAGIKDKTAQGYLDSAEIYQSVKKAILAPMIMLLLNE